MQFGRSFLFCAPGPSPNSLKGWSERGDLNSRPPVPQTGALTELRYAPTLESKAYQHQANKHKPGIVTEWSRASLGRATPPLFAFSTH